MTPEQIMYCEEFHFMGCNELYNYKVRRAGETKRWKKAPSRFKIPVKLGPYGYGYITENDESKWHCSEDCPLLNEKTLY